MTELTTTLNAIRAHEPCPDSWIRLLRFLGKTGPDDEPLGFERISESNGLYDAMWACKTAPQHDRIWRLLAVRYAREAQHLMTDPRSIAALDVAERYSRGEATIADLAVAHLAARDASGSAAWAVAWDVSGPVTWRAVWFTSQVAPRRRQQEIFMQTVRTGVVPEFKP